MTPDNIKGTHVHVHHYHKDNDVTGIYDRNNTFRKALIDVYLLEVYSPKGCVHFQSQRHFYSKQYKEPLHFSFYLFIFTYFFILIGAMNESVLERLRQEAREKEVKIKVEAFRRE